MSEEVTLEVKGKKPLPPPPQTSLVGADQALARELESIPDKMAFKIGEVAELLKLKPYVLRYWETEFKMLNPQKSKNNQRIYSRKHVELLFVIKKLLYKDRFSIEGARSVLAKMRKETKKAVAIRGAAGQLKEIKGKAQALLTDIERIHSLFS